MSQLDPEDIPKRSQLMKDIGTQAKQETQTSKICRSILISDISVQITAWLLLTVGLCIIASTFYVGIFKTNIKIEEHNDCNLNENVNDIDENGSHKHPFDMTTIHSESEVTMLNKTVRNLRLSSVYMKQNNGCWVNNCKVTCTNSDTIKDVIPVTLAQNFCPNIDVLIIKEQIFPNGLLRNPWINLNRTVYELELINSTITNIACSAFNFSPFTYTFQLSLRDLQLEKLGGEVLLGLRSLRFLLIDTPLREIDRVFLQPVQMTLQHLCINSGLFVLSGQTIFGVSILPKLEYADLSNNIFVGPLTRRMFRATPNLRYLHICKSHISAIDIDTFDDFANILKVLDLSDNALTTISDRTVQPLLMGSSRTMISLSYNRWNCDCDLQSFVKVYHIFRKQFIDTIYCHSPYIHFGESLDKLSLEDGECFALRRNIEEYSEYSIANEMETTTTQATTTITPNQKRTSGTTATYQTTENPTRKIKITSKRANLKPTTALSLTVPISAKLKETTHTSYKHTRSAILGSGSRDFTTRSTTDAMNIITMRCLSTPVSGRHKEKRSQGDRRSLEITVNSPASDYATQITNSNEVSKNRFKDKSNPPSLIPTELPTSKPKNITEDARPAYISYIFHYDLKMPTYTFNLTLISNKSVKVFINDYNKRQPINMIWFNRQSEVLNQKIKRSTTQYVDYHCERYQPPHLIVKDLIENCTYTFCVLSKQETISPFDCQPFHVPVSQYAPDGTWISPVKKPLTIGVICTIFVLSTLLGAIVGYFGIRQYPELLEGSDNVVVVKTTGSETNYLKNVDSIRKTSLSRRSTMKLSTSQRETPSLSLPPPPPPPFSVSTYELERLASIKSTATNFEKSFDTPIAISTDQYELPKQFNSLIYEEDVVSNLYAMSPCSPPPLPKRNSGIISETNANCFIKTD